jgi:hypothetical protein
MTGHPVILHELQAIIGNFWVGCDATRRVDGKHGRRFDDVKCDESSSSVIS